jgi:hypothetical protein
MIPVQDNRLLVFKPENGMRAHYQAHAAPGAFERIKLQGDHGRKI